MECHIENEPDYGIMCFNGILNLYVKKTVETSLTTNIKQLLKYAKWNNRHMGKQTIVQTVFIDHKNLDRIELIGTFHLAPHLNFTLDLNFISLVKSHPGSLSDNFSVVLDSVLGTICYCFLSGSDRK